MIWEKLLHLLTGFVRRPTLEIKQPAGYRRGNEKPVSKHVQSTAFTFTRLLLYMNFRPSDNITESQIKHGHLCYGKFRLLLSQNEGRVFYIAIVTCKNVHTHTTKLRRQVYFIPSRVVCPVPQILRQHNRNDQTAWKDFNSGKMSSVQ